ncbi:hypothetical protein J7394_07685 [Ruegeria sp. R13_0]|uniref:hypothetical protein n=1 Tax=Ruegeria sp. R13_0 TaxID=2821099 RepID=UPI001ADA0947|nr:hypothetical protein [Ruegeria sp. R13_0]MBO9434079.1 hypothetical protein [Ruegeria sp. R13_0]
MTDTGNPEYPEAHMPLGVGAIVGETFSIFFKKIHLVLLLGFIPALIEVIVNNYTVGQSFDDIGTAGFDNTAFYSGVIVSALITLLAYAVTTAVIIQFAYDAKLARAARIGSYFSAAVVNLPAIAVLSIVTTILYFIGLVFLVVPGIWIYAVFSVIVPAIVIDRAGFGAMGRSATLTKNYRWPIIGALILMGLCIVLVVMVVTFVFAAAFGFSGIADPTASLGPWAFFEAALNAIAYGWLSITIALIFARLKEIKEGVSVSDLVDVFK